jgi:hypothetical protein
MLPRSAGDDMCMVNNNNHYDIMLQRHEPLSAERNFRQPFVPQLILTLVIFTAHTLPIHSLKQMAVMIPAMLYARTLDSEDANTVFILRAAYGVVQVLCLLAVVYARFVAQSSTTGGAMKVWIPGAKGMFDLPTSPKKYTSKASLSGAFSDKIEEAIRSMGMSVLMTCGLHYYKGMVMGLGIQVVMGPFGVWENAVVMHYIKQGLGMGGKGSVEDSKLLGEIMDKDLTAEQRNWIDAEGVLTITPPAEGEVVAELTAEETEKAKASLKKQKAKAIASTSDDDKNKVLDELILDTWDAGSKANPDGEKLVSYMKDKGSKTVNYQTSESGWTALMIMSGLHSEQAVSLDSIKRLKKAGANLSALDQEGWSAIHWAAFHSSVTGMKALIEVYSEAEVTKCLSVKDKEGKNPLELAVEEKNTEVEDVIRSLLSEESGDKDGLRQRKGKADDLD